MQVEANMTVYCIMVLMQVATGQVASTGMVALGYVQKVSDKVKLASEL